jgi:hypothetical protein
MIKQNLFLSVQTGGDAGEGRPLNTWYGVKQTVSLPRQTAQKITAEDEQMEMPRLEANRLSTTTRQLTDAFNPVTPNLHLDHSDTACSRDS